MISGANVQKTLIPPNIFLKKIHISLKKMINPCYFRLKYVPLHG